MRRLLRDMEERLGLRRPRVVEMSAGQEREAARLLALVLRHTMERRGLRSPLRSASALDGALCSATRRPRVRQDRRSRGRPGDLAKSDIGGRQ
jgi:hypothetical protein